MKNKKIIYAMIMFFIIINISFLIAEIVYPKDYNAHVKICEDTCGCYNNGETNSDGTIKWGCSGRDKICPVSPMLYPSEAFSSTGKCIFQNNYFGICKKSKDCEKGNVCDKINNDLKCRSCGGGNLKEGEICSLSSECSACLFCNVETKKCEVPLKKKPYYTSSVFEGNPFQTPVLKVVGELDCRKEGLKCVVFDNIKITDDLRSQLRLFYGKSHCSGNIIVGKNYVLKHKIDGHICSPLEMWTLDGFKNCEWVPVYQWKQIDKEVKVNYNGKEEVYWQCFDDVAIAFIVLGEVSGNDVGCNNGECKFSYFEWKYSPDFMYLLKDREIILK